MFATTMCLIVEAKAARRELGNAKQFTAAIVGRIDRVAARLELLRTELETLIEPLPPSAKSSD